MRYWPNPAHKQQTTEAGPPQWRPSKEPCPQDLTPAERTQLLDESIPQNPGDAHSRRYNVRRSGKGLEVYDAKWHADVEGEPEFHAHPAGYVPTRVLRALRDAGTITGSEYRRLVKQFGQ